MVQECPKSLDFLFLFFLNLFIYFCSVGSSLLHVGFLQFRRAGATLRYGAWFLTVVASLAVEYGL